MLGFRRWPAGHLFFTHLPLMQISHLPQSALLRHWEGERLDVGWGCATGSHRHVLGIQTLAFWAGLRDAPSSHAHLASSAFRVTPALCWNGGRRWYVRWYVRSTSRMRVSGHMRSRYVRGRSAVYAGTCTGMCRHGKHEGSAPSVFCSREDVPR